ncbi:hypothetical protein BUE80_DR010661 [Diplocarpon rosae]|nr:hypothetical protein BUE80_DR010661 [Diplocarpon rosae]
MPTKRKIHNPRVSAPPDRVYHSSTPLMQTKLPAPRKHIRSYGRKGGKRIAKPVQETLTQIWHTSMGIPLLDENEERGETDGNYEEVAKTRQKRRRTAGDELDIDHGSGKLLRKGGKKRRKTMGDEPEEERELGREKNFHTQSITQMDWSFTSVPGSENEEGHGTEEKIDNTIYDGSISSETMSPPPSRASTSSMKAMKLKTKGNGKGKGESKEKATQSDPSPSPSLSIFVPPPHTPRRRILATEIPSSQSPATPFSLSSRTSTRRSPLKEISNNPIPFNDVRKTGVKSHPEKIPRLEVKDTFDTSEESQATTAVTCALESQKKPSPSKSVRFHLPNDQESEDGDEAEGHGAGSPSVRLGTPRPKKRFVWDGDKDAEGEDREPLSPSSRPSIPKIPLRSQSQEDEANEESRSLFASQDTPQSRSQYLLHENKDLNEDNVSEEPQPMFVEKSNQRAIFRGPIGQRTEILDSDAEDDEDFDDEQPPENSMESHEPTEAIEAKDPGNGESGYSVDDDDELLEEAKLIDNDEEDEYLERLVSRYASPELGSKSMPDQGVVPASHERPEDEEPETCYGKIGLETQFETDRLLKTAEPKQIRNAMRLESRLGTEDGDGNGNGAGDDYCEDDTQNETVVEKTQYIESQRLSTQHVRSMEPRTAESDVFISVHPSSITNITSRRKNHETRNYAFPPAVSRIWMYETAPVSALQYMATIGPAKKPGEITDLSGLGNAEFNKKAASWRAYEILQVYQLAHPKSLSVLKESGWLKSAPAKTVRVAPAVIDELMANLKEPLFAQDLEVEGEAEAEAPVTDTQDEVGEQLLSTIHQFTQPPALLAPTQDRIVESGTEDELNTEITPSGPRRSRQVEEPENSLEEERIASSPQAMLPRLACPTAGSSQATTVDFTQTQTPFSPSPSQIDVVWESPARPVRSSTPLKLPTPRSDPSEGPESLVPFSMASSQLLTKSQLLSDHLQFGQMRGPPPLVVDSDDEDE